MTQNGGCQKSHLFFLGDKKKRAAILANETEKSTFFSCRACACPATDTSGFGEEGLFSYWTWRPQSLVSFSLSRLWSSCLNEHYAPLEHEPFDDHSVCNIFTLVFHWCDWNCSDFHEAFSFLSFWENFAAGRDQSLQPRVDLNLFAVNLIGMTWRPGIFRTRRALLTFFGRVEGGHLA